MSFINAKPLIDGLTSDDEVAVRFAVPSSLLAGLDSGDLDLALCPAIDYQRAARDLVVVPVGAIGCNGPTMTVRLYSRQPIQQIRRVWADTDSHCSVALMRVLLHDLFGLTPEITDYRVGQPGSPRPEELEAVLLIGDKVVTAAPQDEVFPYQMDLGTAWKTLTGLPFVFAVWMAPAEVDLKTVPERLAAQRDLNAQRIDEIVRHYAPKHRWPINYAELYLKHLMRYTLTEKHFDAMRLFWQRSHTLGLTDGLRPLRLYPEHSSAGMP